MAKHMNMVGYLVCGEPWARTLGAPKSCAAFLARQSNPSQKSFEQRKEMTFDGRLANIRAPVVRR